MVSAQGTLGGNWTGGGTWNEQARRVTMLAGELEIVLDEQALIRYDVRDLLSLRRLLEQELREPRRRRRASDRRDVAVARGAGHEVAPWPAARGRLAQRPARWFWFRG